MARPTECAWTGSTLRKVLLSARVAGLREHGADPSGKVLGALTPAVWAEAIDRRTWDHVPLGPPHPERLTLRNTPTKYLLSGLIFSGVAAAAWPRSLVTGSPDRLCAPGRREGLRVHFAEAGRGCVRALLKHPGRRPLQVA